MGFTPQASGISMKVEEKSSGEISADGTEQTIVEISEVSKVGAFISLENMQAGDEVVITEYIKLTESGGYKIYTKETYTGSQLEPVIFSIHKNVTKGWKLTIKQNAGSFRRFEYLVTVQK